MESIGDIEACSVSFCHRPVLVRYDEIRLQQMHE